MNDQDVIKEAYADALKNLYSVLLSGLVAAKQDKTAQKQAAQRFSAGLVLARNARDTALSLL
jgi:hypothetical protein